MPDRPECPSDRRSREERWDRLRSAEGVSSERAVGVENPDLRRSAS